MADIAERAGYSIGAIYHHFGDKKAIQYALFDNARARLGLKQVGLEITRSEPELLDRLSADPQHQRVTLGFSDGRAGSKSSETGGTGVLD